MCGPSATLGPTSLRFATRKACSLTRVAINGLGRIGRATLKILMDTEGLELVAANDIGAADNIAYLLKYDTVYGRYDKPVEVANDGGLSIGGKRLMLLCEPSPARLPWQSLNVDIVFECRTVPARRADLDAHIRARSTATSSFRRRRTTTMSKRSSTE